MEVKMSAAGNKELMLEIYDELSKGNRMPFRNAMAEDFRWIMKGKTAWSRTYDGRDEVRLELLQPLFEQFGSDYKNRPIRVLADGDYVVVECEGSVTTKAGKPYENQYCLIFRLESGKIKELTEYLDTALVNEVLAPPPWAKLAVEPAAA
jgi:ketosteroid isomerase-like protein